MDNSSTLIGLALLLLFVGPIVYIVYHSNKMEKLLHQKARENNIDPDITELTPSLLLGLDSKLQKLLIINTKDRNVNLINLAGIAKCKFRNINIPDRPGKVNLISLELHHKMSEIKPMELVFYDDDDDIHSEVEVQLPIAKKWQKIIDRYLTP